MERGVGQDWGGRREFWRDVLEPTELPSSASSLIERIEKRIVQSRGGCWDIIAERDNEVLFIESKQHGNDDLRLTQRAWIENALNEGASLASFAIVEYRSERGSEQPSTDLKRA